MNCDCHAIVVTNLSGDPHLCLLCQHTNIPVCADRVLRLGDLLGYIMVVYVR